MLYRTLYPSTSSNRLMHSTPANGNETKRNRIATNILETSEAFVLELFLAGFKREDIQIKMDKNDLVVSAKREKKQTEIQWLKQEVNYGDFERRFSLADSIDTDKIGARFENGILELTLPKKAEELARTIEIN